tara:strand:+ start:285 stop:1649 length:1365 start_codon:yes stop_codon:yes gene_type:complete
MTTIVIDSITLDDGDNYEAELPNGNKYKGDINGSNVKIKGLDNTIKVEGNIVTIDGVSEYQTEVKPDGKGVNGYNVTVTEINEGKSLSVEEKKGDITGNKQGLEAENIEVSGKKGPVAAIDIMGQEHPIVSSDSSDKTPQVPLVSLGNLDETLEYILSNIDLLNKNNSKVLFQLLEQYTGKDISEIYSKTSFIKDKGTDAAKIHQLIKQYISDKGIPKIKILKPSQYLKLEGPKTTLRIGDAPGSSEISEQKPIDDPHTVLKNLRGMIVNILKTAPSQIPASPSEEKALQDKIKEIDKKQQIIDEKQKSAEHIQKIKDNRKSIMDETKKTISRLLSEASYPRTINYIEQYFLLLQDLIKNIPNEKLSSEKDVKDYISKIQTINIEMVRSGKFEFPITNYRSQATEKNKVTPGGGSKRRKSIRKSRGKSIQVKRTKRSRKSFKKPKKNNKKTKRR